MLVVVFTLLAAIVAVIAVVAKRRAGTSPRTPAKMWEPRYLTDSAESGAAAAAASATKDVVNDADGWNGVGSAFLVVNQAFIKIPPPPPPQQQSDPATPDVAVQSNAASTPATSSRLALQHAEDGGNANAVALGVVADDGGNAAVKGNSIKANNSAEGIGIDAVEGPKSVKQQASSAARVPAVADNEPSPASNDGADRNRGVSSDVKEMVIRATMVDESSMDANVDIPKLKQPTLPVPLPPAAAVLASVHEPVTVPLVASVVAEEPVLEQSVLDGEEETMADETVIGEAAAEVTITGEGAADETVADEAATEPKAPEQPSLEGTGCKEDVSGETVPVDVALLPEENVPADAALLPEENVPADVALLPEENVPADVALLPEENVPAEATLKGDVLEEPASASASSITVAAVGQRREPTVNLPAPQADQPQVEVLPAAAENAATVLSKSNDKKGGPTSSSAAPTLDVDASDQRGKLGLSSTDLAAYRKLWSQVGSQNGLVTGKVALAFFQSSALPKATLKTIWGLSDTSSPKGKLSQQEFFVALKLVAMAQAGKAVAIGGIGTQLLPLPKVVGSEAAASPTPLTATLERTPDTPIVPTPTVSNDTVAVTNTTAVADTKPTVIQDTADTTAAATNTADTNTLTETNVNTDTNAATDADAATSTKANADSNTDTDSDSDTNFMLETADALWTSAPTTLSGNNVAVLPARRVAAVLATSGVPQKHLRAIWSKAKAESSSALPHGEKSDIGSMTKEEFVRAVELVVEQGGKFTSFGSKATEDSSTA